MTIHPHENVPPLTDAEILRWRQRDEDYGRLNAFGRIVWRTGIVLGGFAVGAATFMAAMASYFNSTKVH